jgi:heterodisulfide reductase subunit C
MYALKKLIGDTILSHGYCVHADGLDTENFPEMGPVWDWIRENIAEIYNRVGNSYNREGNGALRKISKNDLSELNEILRITGTIERFDKIETDAIKHSELEGLEIDDSMFNDYFRKYF